MSTPVPPPTRHQSIAEAHTRLNKKRPLYDRFRARKPSVPAPDVSVAALPLAGPDPICLDPSSATAYDNADQDQYRWAVVYENQRGLKLFSSLYYSPLSLLPTDPSPFTVPHSKRAKQPELSLLSYPLPDGSWRWLSPWMVDMRSDSGEVQYDGFEFNFMFRAHKWHPEAGPWSWVRRRRWIRLMMRPAKKATKTRKLDDSLLSPNATPVTPARYSTASFPPSVLDSHLEGDSFFELDVDEVWLSDDLDDNWDRYCAAIRRAGRDGRILELWRRWFGDEPQDSKSKRKQWTEDDDPVPSDSLTALSPAVHHNPPPIANILPTLRRHGDAILHSFIYPESRARFIQLLERVGVLRELNAGVSPSEVEFWSYLGEVGGDGILPKDSTVKRI